ncbi:hypothetical protein CR513_09399, partial [Mucuna pruriens]
LEATKTTRGEPSTLVESSPQIFWGQPFSEEIDETQVPPNFREVVVEPVDGTQDPHAHLQVFQTQMYISEGNNKLSCKLFPGTLRGVAMQWMATLPARTIRTFNDLASTFVSQFAANKVKKLEVAYLFDIRQARGESLKNYLTHFNNATVRVNDPNQKFFVKAFQKGLKASPFNDSLNLKRPASMEEIRMRAEKHEERSRNGGDDSQTTDRRVTHKPDIQKRSDNKRFTPLNEKRAQILKEICHTRLLCFPPPSEGKVLGNNRVDWCDFHCTTSHSTEACWTLKTQIERLIQEGRLNQYVRLREERQGTRRSRSRQGSPVLHRGTITTISGGVFGLPPKDYQKRKEVQAVLTGANLTPLGRRMSGPVITFTDRDIRRGRTGCDEPMVISVVAAEYKIERVLVDQGSSANILYWTTAKKLGIQNLTKCQGALYGFAGERVPIKGTVELETTFEEDRNGARTIPVLYTVVDAEASYNIIIGRPTLNRLEATVSIHHLCMKFPVGQTIATVWADVGIARRCYEDSLKVESTPKGQGVNVLDFDLDPRHFSTEERPHPVGDLKEVQIGPSDTQKTKIDKTLGQEGKDRLVRTLRRNVDVFA